MGSKIFILVLCMGFGPGARAQVQAHEQEPALKAAFIYNFTKYIEWEGIDSEADFTIGVLGASAVSKALADIAQFNKVNNKKIVIKNFSSPDEIENIDILFIAQSNSYSLKTVLSVVNRGVLTIGEEPGSAKQGTALNFVIQNDKLKFEANLKAFYLAGLKASSQLLKLAIIVN